MNRVLHLQRASSSVARMAIILHHHPFTRAAGIVWALEEVGLTYELRFVDLTKGEQKRADFLAKNPMGKLPVLEDGDVVVSEVAAIGMYLADRYAHGTLAPKLDTKQRARYLRACLVGPSVIEPAALAKAAKWEYRPSNAGFGTFESMMDTVHELIGAGPFVLGAEFSMADVLFGGTVRYMTRFKMMEATAPISSYLERINARPAFKRSEEVNAKVIAEHKLG